MPSFKSIRKRIYDIIDATNEEDNLSRGYDIFMIIVIAISMIPLMTKAQPVTMHIIDKVTVIIFIIDYLLRLLTADFKFERKSPTSFLRYPFSPMAIIDLLSILPSLIVLNQSLKALRLFRLARALRVFRIFKVIRYSKNLQRLKNVWASSKSSLAVVGGLALGYIFVSALVVFNVEPDSFKNFFEAIYWATVSLTTVGYGDLYPVTTIGRVITMVSSIFGVAVIALPAGIITAGYMKEVENEKNNENSEMEKE